MSITPYERRLLRVSKATIRSVREFREGANLEATLSRSLGDLVHQVVADRLRLADEFLDMADRLRRSRADLARSSISRYYYAMYHAMRAAAYQFHQGDDHENHSKLGDTGVPTDYPNRSIAQNTLKNARLLRNEADYDPYPSSTKYFKAVEKNLKPTAAAFVREARIYVQSKGNPYA